MTKNSRKTTCYEILGESVKLFAQVSEMLEESSHELKNILDNKQEVDKTKVIGILISNFEFWSAQTGAASTGTEKFLKEMDLAERTRKKWGF